MTSRKLTDLFRAAADDLAAVEGPESRGRIRCPLCLRYFSREALSAGQLTREHILPRSVGGRLVTITCKECNNEHGSRLDSHLAGAAAANDASAGLGSFRSVARIDDSRLAVNFTPAADEDAAYELAVIQKATNPADVEKVVESLKEGSEINLTISFGYGETSFHLGLLRAAYLFAFHRHGYTYALAPASASVRCQILGAEAPSPDLPGIIKKAQFNGRLPSPVMQCDLGPLLGLPVLLTIVQLRIQLVANYFVLIPSVEAEPPGSLDRLPAISRELHGRHVTISRGVMTVG